MSRKPKLGLVSSVLCLGLHSFCFSLILRALLLGIPVCIDTGRKEVVRLSRSFLYLTFYPHKR